MTAGRWLALGLLAAGSVLTPPPFSAVAQPADARVGALKVTGATVRGHGSVCHDYRLVEAQRLDRATWEWVMEDMVEKYGATWIVPEFRRAIVEYLVEHHGPER